MKRTALFTLVLVLIAATAPLGAHAAEAGFSFDMLSGAGSVTGGESTYAVAGGVMVKRPPTEAQVYFNSQTLTWHILILSPGEGEIVVGLVFDKDNCPARHPGYMDMGGWAPTGTEPVAYGDKRVWEYTLDLSSGQVPQPLMVISEADMAVGFVVPTCAYLSPVNLTERLAESITELHVQDAAEPVKVYGGIGWISEGPVAVQDYGANRFVVRTDSYKPGDLTLCAFFGPEQDDKTLYYVAQDYNRAFITLGARPGAFDIVGFSDKAALAAGDSPIACGKGIPGPWMAENTVYLLTLLGEGNDYREVSFIINPKGDFAFPVLSFRDRESSMDAKHQAAFDRLGTLIRAAQEGELVSFDARGLDYLPFYLADELCALSGRDIILSITYTEEGEEKTCDINSTDVKPAAANRIFYPLTAPGLAALKKG